MLSWLCAAVLALAVQDAPPDATALQAEFDALLAEYDAYAETFWASLPRDESGEMTLPPDRAGALPDKVFAPRFLELGRRAGTAPAGAAALTEALGMAESADEIREVADLLLERFLGAPQLERAATGMAWMRYRLGNEPVVAWLRKVVDGSPHAPVRAAATLALAECLFNPGTRAGAGGAPEQDAPDPAAARELLAALQEAQPGTPHAERAGRILFELDHLQVGMVAPDIEAVDQDGVSFRLSDYRGKVVLLVFWGFW